MPRIGALRRRLTLETATDVTDGAGGSVRTWVMTDAVFAETETTAIREDVADGRAVGIATHRVTIRWRSDVTRAMRFVDGPAHYRVIAVKSDARKRFLTCLCEEESA